MLGIEVSFKQVSESLPKKVTSEEKPEGGEAVNAVVICRKWVPSRETAGAKPGSRSMLA